MGGFAPGTAQYGDQRERRFRHEAQRNLNISDLMLGLGAMAQALGNRRRMAEQQANDAYLAQQVAQPAPEMAPQSFTNPQSGQYDPQAQEAAGQTATASQGAPLRYARPATAFQNLANTFNPFYKPEGGLTGQAALGIASLRAKQAGAQATAGYRAAQLRGEQTKQTETERHNRAMEARPVGGGNPDANLRGWMGTAKELSDYEDKIRNTLADPQAGLGYTEKELMSAAISGIKLAGKAIPQNEIDAERTRLRGQLEQIQRLKGTAYERAGAENLPLSQSPPPAQAVAPAGGEHPLISFGRQYAASKGWNWDELTDDQLNEIRSAFQNK